MSCLTSSTGTTMFLRLTPLAAIFLALSVPAADAAVWRVTPADDVEDIVDNAEEGDTIIFAKGEYKVNLLLTEPLSLKGEDGAVINAGGKGSGITIRRSRTTVENLTIKNYGGDLYKRDSGVRVMDGCTGVKLTNLKLFGSGFGIRADRLDNLEIRDCEITGNSRRHILDRGDGVFLNYVKHSKLINNKIKNVRDGFYFENTDATEAVGNHFDNTQYGIHWMYTRNDIGYDNVTVNSVGGFALMSSKRIMCRDNTARDNVEFGILLNVCEGCTVRSNLVEGVHNPKGKAALDTEGKGLFIYGPGASRVEGNAFTGADIGIGVALGGEKTIVTENVFDKNTIQVRYVGKAPLEWSENGRGNYWSTFMSWDADGNGIADTPYQPNDSLDRIFWIYPEARFLMQSPVTALLRWFAARLEIDRGKGVTDSHPLMTAPVVKGAAQ